MSYKYFYENASKILHFLQRESIWDLISFQDPNKNFSRGKLASKSIFNQVCYLEKGENSVIIRQNLIEKRGFSKS